MVPLKVLPLRNRVDIGVMAMKGYFTFPKTPRLKPPDRMQFSDIPRTLNCFSFAK